MSQSKANILVIGGGGIGTISALNLITGGQARVTMVLRSNIRTVTTKGFDIDSVDHGKLTAWRPDEILNQIPTHTTEDFIPYDYLVCATKNLVDVSPTVADLIKPAVTPGHTAIILIQNGLNIDKPVVTAFPYNIILSGVAFTGSHEPSPGFISHTFADRLVVGAFSNPQVPSESANKAAQDFVTRYAAGGKTVCEYTSDANFCRWQKLIYNGTMNPICALLRTDTTRIRLSGAVESLVRPAMEEIRAAAKAKGYVLPEEVVQEMIDMDPMEIYFRPSMCVDVDKGNLTEYEVLVGEPLREGLACGVLMPTLTVLYNLCKALQWQLKEERDAR